MSSLLSATVVKTEAGSLPEGKVKIKLEHDGTVLDVDEDDVEKVSGKLKDLEFKIKLIKSKSKKER